MNEQQYGLLANDIADNIATPVNSTGVRLFKNTADGKYYIKKSDGTTEEFSVSISGMMDFRGSYDASSDLFPATGGSGVDGAIQKGDTWVISVAGTLGGSNVEIGDLLIAEIDAPGQVAGNWTVLEKNLGYVPENVANKADNYNTVNSTKYPTTNATEQRYVKTLFQHVADANNVDAAESDLYSNSLAASTFDTVGDRIKAKYVLTTANNINAKTLKVYFAGSEIYDSSDSIFDFANLAYDVEINVEIIAIDANTVKCSVTGISNNLATAVLVSAKYTTISPVDFTAPNILKITGQGAATNDVVAKFATSEFVPAA